MTTGDELGSDNRGDDLSLRRAQRAAYSDATRYLCVAGEIDGEFGSRVISELFPQPKRAVAPSFGVDLVPIVNHCVRGRRRRAIRDFMLLILVLAELVLFPIPTALAVLAVILLRQTNLRVRLGGRAIGQVLVGAVLLAGVWVLFGPSIPVSTAGLPDWTTEISGLVGQAGPFLASLLLLFFLAVVIRYGEWRYGQWLVNSHLRDINFNPDAGRVNLPGWMQRRVDAIARQQYAEATLFESGNDLPFVGAGSVGRWWSFALNLHPPTDEASAASREVEPFTPKDLHRYVKEHLLALRKPEQGLAYGLPGLVISEHMFAPGWYRLAGEPPHILFDEGRGTPAQVDQVVNGPATSLRHFQCLRAEWQGRELVAAAFLHLATEGRTLYVEFTPCLLSPIRALYKNVDNWTVPRRDESLAEIARSVRDVVPTLFGSPARLARTFVLPYLERLEYARIERRQRTRRHTVDYGARTSVRELGSIHEPKNYLQLFDPEKYVMSPRRYLQLLDTEKYTKTIEAQALDAIAEFLENRGADTSELRRRRTEILNTGVFIPVSTQGDIEAWGQRPSP